MMHLSPSLISAGKAAIISPDGSGRIPPELWAEYAAIVLLEPEPELLAEWTRSLEVKLGVRDVHRIAVEGGEIAVRQALRRDQAVRRQSERRRAAVLSATLQPPAFATDIERDLKKLEQAEAEAVKARDEANSARDRGDVKAHRAAVARERDAYGRARILRRAIRDARERQLDGRWAAQANAETEALARARGEQVDEEPTAVSDWLRNPETGAIIREGGLPVLGTERATARRVNDRDPLRSLFDADHLTREQYDTGRVVIDLYDARVEGLGSSMRAMGGVTSRACDNSHMVFGGVQRGKALQRLGTIERQVALQCRDEPACLQMLRAVCGERKPLSWAGKGRAFERHAKALARALDVASAY
jgi:hypothetical protein